MEYYQLMLIILVPVVAFWGRMESRMSKLEGKFDMLLMVCPHCKKSSDG